MRGLRFGGLLGGLAGFVGVLLLAEVPLSGRSRSRGSTPRLRPSGSLVPPVEWSLNLRIGEPNCRREARNERSEAAGMPRRRKAGRTFHPGNLNYEREEVNDAGVDAPSACQGWSS